MSRKPAPRSLSSVSHPPSKPLMVYDGDCGFCRKWINRWRVLTGDRVDYKPFQKIATSFPEIPPSRFEAAVQLIEPDGGVSQGAHAVFKTLALNPFFRWVLGVHDHVPGVAFLAESLYAFVAGHRHVFSSVDACGLAPADKPATYLFSRWLFLKGLALIYLTAFGSLLFQVKGLIGERGILPVHLFLSGAQAQWGSGAYWFFPTLCWLQDSDNFLLFLCGGGSVLSIFLLLDWAPFLCLTFLWVFYLSLVTAGQEFLGFQWDNLLLEAGFLSVFLVPVTWKPGRSVKGIPSRLVLFLFQWLLFRLMFSSGYVKWASGDPTWHALTALQYHYGTQPLPTPLAWFMNQLPAWFQKISCLYMFGVEWVAPFFIFGPRRWRPYLFGVLASLQVLILLTGNYCFFNYLALALCLFVMEDEAWPAVWRRWALFTRDTGKQPPAWPGWVRGPAAGLVLFLSAFQMTAGLGGPGWPSPLVGLVQTFEPFRSVNGYGLFAVMTTSRPEILVEGSRDGKDWKAYEFKWKPGDPSIGPHWVAPYQPRLDWQMWFAALGDPRQNPWIVNFLIRLLQGTPEVLGLLRTNPFTEGPPIFIRARSMDYRFTTFQERVRSGHWWESVPRGIYIPPFSLADLTRH